MLREKDSTKKNNFLKLFQGEGEMASLMREYDWDAHPLGNPDGWPESLKTAIRIILHSDFPMFIWWSPDLYMFHNDAYLPALGKKHPKALGASAREMWSEIWEQLGGIAEEILKGGESFYAQELLILLERKGFLEETYWTFSYSPAPNDRGGVGGVFCACNEVTKSVLGQRRLTSIKHIADAAIQVKTVEEASQAAVSVLSENTRDIPFSLIYLLNGEETKARLLGRSGELPQHMAPAEVTFNPQQNGEDFWRLSEVLSTKKGVKISQSAGEYISGDSETQPATVEETVILPVMKPGEEKLIGFFVAGVSPYLEYDFDYQNFHALLSGQIATFISTVQAREDAARQQEELINLFQQSPVAITILRGEKFVVEMANRNICEVWGRSHEEVINKPIFDVLLEARGQGLEELLQDVLLNGVTHSFSEYVLVLNRNGRAETVYLNFIYYPFRNSKGVITGIIAIAVEVTEQVLSRQQIEAKNKELLAINADLDNFVYSASHDLKGPILNIDGLMKVLLPKLPDQCLESQDVEKVVNLIFSSIDRLKATITDLAEVSRVQKEADEDVREVDIAEVVEDVLSDLHLGILETEAHIEAAFESCPIRFSPKNLRSIVYNLLSNAIKYRSLERQLRIYVSCEIKGEELVFSVKDNGLGMNLKYESKIFSMFKRLHSHVEGTGIGLYIVKRIVENAGGRIEVESEVGKGSVFTIYLKYDRLQE